MYLSPIYVRRVCRRFWCATRGDSQAKHETLWLEHHGWLKKRDLNKARHERRDYTRGSKARQMFPSTFSFLPCLEFLRRECTAGMRIVDNEARHSRHSHFLWLRTDLPTYLRELRKETRIGRECGRWEKVFFTLSFSSCLVLSRRECKPDIMADSWKKYLLYQKILQIKHIWELNFLQKTQRTHMPISFNSGAKGLQRLSRLKYYKALKWKSRFTLGLNVAKNRLYEKMLQIKVAEIKISYKTLRRRIHLSLPGVEWGTPKNVVFQIL